MKWIVPAAVHDAASRFAHRPGCLANGCASNMLSLRQVLNTAILWRKRLDRSDGRSWLPRPGLWANIRTDYLFNAEKCPESVSRTWFLQIYDIGTACMAERTQCVSPLTSTSVFPSLIRVANGGVTHTPSADLANFANIDRGRRHRKTLIIVLIAESLDSLPDRNGCGSPSSGEQCHYTNFCQQHHHL